MPESKKMPSNRLKIAPPFARLTFPFGLPEVSATYAEDLLGTIWRGIEPV